MFRKSNKRGFSLIEMMVVIAIIAVLVSIIIPTVGNSTVKANAAANAANLRSIEGELTSMHLLGDVTFGVKDPTYTYRAAGGVLGELNNLPAPVAKECGKVAADTEMWVRVDNDGSVNATYKGYGVDYFAQMAETGKEPDSYDMNPTDKLLNDTEAAFDNLRENYSQLGTLGQGIMNGIAQGLGYGNMDDLLNNAEDAALGVGGQMDAELAQGIIDLSGTLDGLLNGGSETPDNTEGEGEEVPPTTETDNCG